jgi:hypothetical protein
MTPNTPQAKKLSDIVPEIVRMTDPEKIILLSASFSTRITENIFIRKPSEELIAAQYNLLVLTGYRDNTILSRMELMMLGWLSCHPNLQLQLVDIHEFNKRITEGEEYSISILSNAFICYDRERIELTIPEYFARA